MSILFGSVPYGDHIIWTMSWIRKSDKTWMQRASEYVLKAGPIPRHVAFIMDGNRRYASKNSLDRAEGHLMGFDKLAEVGINYKCI